MPCAPGTYTPERGQEACYACKPGTFQDVSSAVACKACESGSFCWKRSENQGAPAPTKCRPGTFSNATNLSRLSCSRSNRTPLPCAQS